MCFEKLKRRAHNLARAAVIIHHVEDVMAGRVIQNIHVEIAFDRRPHEFVDARIEIGIVQAGAHDERRRGRWRFAGDRL